MATETVPAAQSAQSWPHEGQLIRLENPAVIFNPEASLQELASWAYGQTQMAIRCLVPSIDDDTEEGRAVGSVHAMLEPLLPALRMLVERMEATRG